MENVYAELKRRAQYARNSRSLALLYETNGMKKMARELGAITKAQAMELNEIIVRNGINNPQAYDR